MNTKNSIKFALKLLLALIFTISFTSCIPVNLPELVPPVSPRTTTPVSQYGQLKVVGTKVCDQSGNPIQLRGMSMFWSNWAGKYWNAASINTLADDWQSGIVRAAMGIEGDTSGAGYLDAKTAELAKLTTVVDAAIAKGIYVIIDWHDHHALAHQSEAYAFFTTMGTKYKDSPNVIWEIFNEPLADAKWSDIKTYAIGAIAAIRATGANQLILVGSPVWDQAVDQPAADPITTDANIAYTLHFYVGMHGQWLRDRAAAALKTIPLFVSEWGIWGASSSVFDKTDALAWIDFMNANQLSWCAWSFNDKVEPSSALSPYNPGTGPWSNSNLTPVGVFYFNHIVAP